MPRTLTLSLSINHNLIIQTWLVCLILEHDTKPITRNTLDRWLLNAFFIYMTCIATKQLIRRSWCLQIVYCGVYGHVKLIIFYLLTGKFYLPFIILFFHHKILFLVLMILAKQFGIRVHQESSAAAVQNFMTIHQIQVVVRTHRTTVLLSPTMGTFYFLFFLQTEDYVIYDFRTVPYD